MGPKAAVSSARTPRKGVARQSMEAKGIHLI
jgi:hypothetical protein